MDHAKEIVRLLEGVNTGRWMMLDVFADFCRLAALSVESPFTSGDLKREIEDGYAAVVRHENALTRQVLSRPRFTPGYFLHGFPMRGYKLGKPVA